MVPAGDAPRRADALRNREAILAAAGLLFADRGAGVQMEEVAGHSGLGMGTLYRHFPTKQALLAAIVTRRFAEMTDLARHAADDDDAGEAFDGLVRTYLEAAERDAAFRYALLGPEDFDWGDLAEQKEAFLAAARPIIERAVTGRHLRADFTMADFIMITRGVMTNMTPHNDWRRHLELALAGVRLRRA